MARLRNSPKPVNGTCTTRAPSASASATVPSVLLESATTTSSAQSTLDTAASILAASL
jgi:hypothetical protein